MDFLNDPFGIANTPFARPALARAQSSSLPDIPPEEQEGILAGLGRSALGGLGYIGGSLDKAFGGRAIRGVLGGKPEELLSLIPFSDKLGITDENNAVSGKELLGYDRNDDSWGGTLAGMGTEMLLDPGTFLSFGSKALTPLGQTATKAGVMPKRVAAGIKGLDASSPEAMKLAQAIGPAGPVSPKQLADVADKPLRGLANISLPFMGDSPIATLGTGATGQKIAGIAGNLLDKAVYSAPGRAIAPLVDHRLSDFGPSPTTDIGQRLVRDGADFLDEVATPEIRGKHIEERRIAELLGMTDEATAPAANRELRGLMEGFGPIQAPNRMPEIQLPSRIPGLNNPETAQQVEDLIYKWRNELDDSLARSQKVGRASHELTDPFAQYFPRQLTPALEDFATRELGGTNKFVSARNPNQIARDPAFSLPGGTNAVNDLFVDPLAVGSTVPGVGNNPLRAARHIRREYLDWTPQVADEFRTLRRDYKAGHLPPQILDPATNLMVDNPQFLRLQELQKAYKQSKTLSKLATRDIGDNLSARVAAGENPATVFSELTGAMEAPFQNNPLGDLDKYRMGDAKSNKAAQIFKDLVTSRVTRKPGPDTVPLAEVIEKSGYGNANMRQVLAQALGSKKDFAGLHVPADIAQDAMRFGPVFGGTREINPLLKVADSLTNLTKVSQTTMLPFTIPTLMRNAIGEFYTNLIGGARDPNAGLLGGWLKPLADSHNLRRGGTIDSLGHLPGFQQVMEYDVPPGFSPQNYTPQSKGKVQLYFGTRPNGQDFVRETVPLPADLQTRKLQELMYQHGVAMPFDKHEAAALVGRGARDSDVGAGVLAPLQPQAKSVGEIVKGAVPQSWQEANPLNIRGWMDKTETTFAPAQAAQELMHTADEMGRQSAFIAYLQQGFEPAAAAQKAKAMRMDPDSLTGFERGVMKRLIPYYNWMRTAIPGMTSEVAQNPGGLVGQSVRGTNALRQQDGLIPDFVGEGLALPIGGRDDDGTQRYMTGLGLPFEELNRIADNGANPIARTLQKLLGAVNPLIKAPLELASGTQFYSGRHLDDLYDRTGVDQILMNSPLGTVSRTASRFADPRKSLIDALAGTVSPARITDADMERARLIQGRRLLEEQLRTNPGVRRFQQIYAPDDVQAQMSPEELQMLAMYQSLLREARANPRPAAAR